LRVRKPIGSDRELQLSAYHLWRDFENRLPLSKQVAYDRRVSGGSLLYLDGSSRVFWTSGLDLALQNDQRRNYQNPGGGRGELNLDQREAVRSLGAFLQGELDLGHDFGIVGGLRYDWSEFKVDDRFLTDQKDDSDRLRFRELSPRLGLRYGRSPRFRVYANYSTAFRVPTTTELKPADGSGGFDSGIDPERSSGLEIGVKGLLAQRLVYDLALFQLRVRNALIPFTKSLEPGGEPDTFYRNAGQVRRRGLELGLSALLRPGVSLRTVYTYSRFRYHDFDYITGQNSAEQRVKEFDGRVEPNTPQHSLAGELRMEHRTGLFAVLALRHFSDIEVNDENSQESPGATVSDLRAGFRWKRRGASIVPFLGFRNWSGAEYDGSLRPNDSRGRFFEPAPEREIYAGLEIRFEPREWR
jgi:iron complex outermembrane receptor protein